MMTVEVFVAGRAQTADAIVGLREHYMGTLGRVTTSTEFAEGHAMA